jgi:hypothetical protein
MNQPSSHRPLLEPGSVKLGIVGPSFFSYVPAIAAGFERCGFATVVYDERHSNRVADKILYRIGAYHGPLSPKHSHLSNIRSDILAKACTDVLLVDVEVIDRPFVEALIGRGVRVHLYMWDSARNKPRFTSYLDIATSSGSFDPKDCERFGMSYIPLFAEPLFDRSSASDGDAVSDIGFCGTVHSSRTAILAELLATEKPRRLSLNLMLYYHSRALFGVKGLLDPSVWRLFPLVRDAPFTKDDIATMFGRSKFVLDVPHPGQTGMTARTFEVLIAGTRLLTFNRVAADLLPKSLQSRVAVINKASDVQGIDFNHLAPLPPLTDEERYYLSLQRFVDQLLGMMNLAPECEPNQQRRAGHVFDPESIA